MQADFLHYQAQTTPYASGLEVVRASGNYIYDRQGKKYLDLVAGVSALPLGHGHPAIIKAITTQLERYSHVMVYGEFALQPAVDLCKKLASLLPDPLSTTYLVNSGTEAIEASLKLARRATGRSEIIAMNDCYHGNTLGSLSLMDYEERKAPFRPLLPGIKHIRFNCVQQLNLITNDTAAVIIESIQGGAGFLVPSKHWFEQLRSKCDQRGALLIIDEIQPGIGRTGSMFYFTQHGIVPDIVVTGKGLAGGMPIGALTASKKIMSLLQDNPMLGHITTFGGHPIIAAAALATLNEIISGDYLQHVGLMELRFRESLNSQHIKEIRGKGLMLAILLADDQFTVQIVNRCRELGILVFLLLFEKRAIRISPPYTITGKEVVESCAIINRVIDEFYT
ncbi:MAG: aspartate aminotransferase family protein [Nonlabens sp.]